MTMRTIAITILALALAAAAAVGQERPRRGGPPGSPPFAERLHEIRMERLQEALELSDEATVALREEMERNRRAHRDALEARRGAIRELREELAEDPIRESEIARALEGLERHHETMGRLQREHHARLAEVLTPSQRARFLVFSRRFDERLRQMLHRGRGPLGPDRNDARVSRRGVERRPGPPAGGPREDPEARADALRRRIERMENAMERMRDELRRLESGE